VRLSCAALVCLLFCLSLGGSANAAGATKPEQARVRDEGAFIILDAATPLDLYEVASRLPPAGSTGVYTHAGAEYGIVVSGRITRWDAGRARAMEEGDSFASPAGAASEIRAPRGSVQISAFLQPRRAPPAATHAAVIFSKRFAVAALPPTPFTLVEQLIDIPPRASTVRFSYGGQAFCTIAEGQLAVEQSGVLSWYRLGESFAAAPGEVIRFANANPRPGSVQVAVLLPEAVHLTRPSRAY
jgi:quercetin dioxygenase-like cupin family protein